MTAIVLAGGQSTRLGRDKVWEKVGEVALVNRVILSLLPLGTEIVVVTRSAQTLPPLPYHVPVKRAVDLYPGRASLGGLYTGLMAATSFPCLVVACDMPFLNLRLLRYLLDLSAQMDSPQESGVLRTVSEAPDFNAVVPWPDGRAEPLHAVYSRRCLGPIKELLEAGEQKIIDLFPKVTVRRVEGAELDSLDPERLSFFNINTQADLEWAREVVARQTQGAAEALARQAIRD